jgi:segregation and condensation protein B
MRENENDMNAAEVPDLEERQAEEFADEMHAEPKNIDGEPGVATPDEEANAEAAEQTSESLSAEEILAPDAGKEQPKWPAEDAELTAMLEAVIYVSEEPLTLDQISAALEQPRERMKRLLDDLVAEWQKPQHGLAIREVAGGYKMATKPEHHDAVRQFVKSLKPLMKLSLPALETLAVIAYKQPVTAPEIMEIRGVQGAGVLKTLLDRKLISAAGRKNVIGKPILYKTNKEFLVQFGLKDLSELPSVKEFEELARFATSDPEPDSPVPPAPEAQPAFKEPGEPEPKQEDPQPQPVTESVPEPVAE